MQRATIVAVFCAVAIFACLGVWPPAGQAVAQRYPGQPEPSGTPGLVAFLGHATDQHQSLMVLDPVRKSLAVYHVDSASGSITLKSERNLAGDLELSDYNGVSPLPEEIRSMLGRGRGPESPAPRR